MLLIRLAHIDGDRTGLQLLDIAHQVSPLLFRIALVFVAETLGNKTPDSRPQNPIGHKIALGQRFVPGGLHYVFSCGTVFGNHGTKALVVRW